MNKSGGWCSYHPFMTALRTFLALQSRMYAFPGRERKRGKRSITI
jgi:hypothetical protein